MGKTGNTWKTPFVVQPKKYTQIEMSYENPEEMADKLAQLEDSTVTLKTAASKLDKKTQEFISLIFNEDMFKEQMVSFNIDVKKMPLGQLSKPQIERGYDVLKNLKKELDKGSANRHVLEQLSSKFYTNIPHAFGRRPPQVLDSAELVQKKMDMLAVLGDIELAANMNKKKKSKKSNSGDVIEKPHPLDEHYANMRCDLAYVDPTSEEFTMVQTYAQNTGSHYRKPTVINLWRVEREGEGHDFLNIVTLETENYFGMVPILLLLLQF